MNSNIIFLGNNEATLKSLIQCNINIKAVIYENNHDLKHTGVYDNAVKSKGGTVIEIPKDNKTKLLEAIKNFPPPDMFLISYFTVLPKEALSIPKKIINIHPSMLPYYKGPHPIKWALINGEKKIGVSFMTITETVDTGGIYYQFSIDVTDKDNYLTLFNKTNKLIDKHLCKIISRVLNEELVPKKQEGCGSYFPKLSKDIRYINFLKMTARDIFNLTRSQIKYGGVITTYNQKRIEFDISNVFIENKIIDKPGTILKISLSNTGQYDIIVQCIKGQILFRSNNIIFQNINEGECLGT